MLNFLKEFVTRKRSNSSPITPTSAEIKRPRSDSDADTSTNPSSTPPSSTNASNTSRIVPSTDRADSKELDPNALTIKLQEEQERQAAGITADATEKTESPSSTSPSNFIDLTWEGNADIAPITVALHAQQEKEKEKEMEAARQAKIEANQPRFDQTSKEINKQKRQQHIDSFFKTRRNSI